MLRKLFFILSSYERRQAYILAVLMVIYALLEVSGIASIAPFLAILGDKNAVDSHPKLKFIYDVLPVSNMEEFMTALGVISLLVLICASIFKGFVIFAKSKYTNMCKHNLSNRLIKKYAHQPYSFFLKRNSGELTKSIFIEIEQLIANSINPLLDFISYLFVIIAIIALLLFVNPGVALSIGLVFGFFYLLFYFKIRKGMMSYGTIIREENTISFQKTAEVLSGIKELKLLGREKGFLDQIEPSLLRRSQYAVKAQMSSEIPRYAIEVLGFSTVFGFLFYMISRGQDLSVILPTLGVYVFAGYRLLPAMQNVYMSLTKLRYGRTAVDVIYNDLMSSDSFYPASSETLKLSSNFEVKNLGYTYPESESATLEDISFLIPAKTSIGIVGSTGAGKSTLVDLMLGLLTPDKGSILINDEPLSEKNIRSWQNNIGYVPQQIFLSDDKIVNNIAFGVPDHEIDIQAVMRAAELAQISQFIEQELPEKYNTKIGERGIRLSGGQRQRIGIARALYYNPDVIIFDEATSALDNETEANLMKAINSLMGEKTIIMIAHRLQTIERCNFILSLDKGRVASFTKKN